MPENKRTSLLTPEENELVFSLLGPKCRTLATTVVQLYTTRGKDSGKWYFETVGVLCHVKDELKRSYFFRILSLVENQKVWEHEIYNDMDYMAPEPFFHTFEAEGYIAAFNFVDTVEGFFMRKTVIEKLETRRRRRNNIQKHNSKDGKLPVIQGPESKPITSSTNDKAEHKKKKKSWRKGKKEKKKQLTTSDIGRPENFKHVGHVGWDTSNEGGAQTMGLELHKFLQRAGVSENHLKDKATWNFILDFITENGGMEAVAGAETSHGTGGPPAYPPPPLPKDILSPEIPARPLPSRPGATVPPPPPPPPDGPSPLPPSGPRAPPTDSALDEQVSSPHTSAVDPRQALLDAIRNRHTLRQTGKDSENISKELKPVSEEQRSSKRTGTVKTGDIASLLRDVLAERFKANHQDPNEESNESSSERWSSSDSN